MNENSTLVGVIIGIIMFLIIAIYKTANPKKQVKKQVKGKSILRNLRDERPRYRSKEKKVKFNPDVVEVLPSGRIQSAKINDILTQP